MFAIPITIFLTGWKYNGTRNNLLTVVAIVGVLPAAKFAVSFIMMAMQKDAPADVVEKTDRLAGNLVHAYEMTFTLSEGQMPCDAVVIGNKNVVMYSERGKKNMLPLFEKHIVKALATSDHRGVKAKIFQDKNRYLQRIEMLSKETTDHDFDEGCLITLKAISL